MLKLFSTVAPGTGLPGYNKVSSQFATICKRLKEGKRLILRAGSINTKLDSSANSQVLELCITKRSRRKLHQVLLKRTYTRKGCVKYRSVGCHRART